MFCSNNGNFSVIIIFQRSCCCCLHTGTSNNRRWNASSRLGSRTSDGHRHRWNHRGLPSAAYSTRSSQLGSLEVTQRPRTRTRREENENSRRLSGLTKHIVDRLPGGQLPVVQGVYSSTVSITYAVTVHRNEKNYIIIVCSIHV